MSMPTWGRSPTTPLVPSSKVADAPLKETEPKLGTGSGSGLLGASTIHSADDRSSAASAVCTMLKDVPLVTSAIARRYWLAPR
jgi:hypothetical protein